MKSMILLVFIAVTPPPVHTGHIPTRSQIEAYPGSPVAGRGEKRSFNQTRLVLSYR